MRFGPLFLPSFEGSGSAKNHETEFQKVSRSPAPPRSDRPRRQCKSSQLLGFRVGFRVSGAEKEVLFGARCFRSWGILHYSRARVFIVRVLEFQGLGLRASEAGARSSGGWWSFACRAFGLQILSH